ncbi:efflux transporter outer membrane subunit [Sphingomonas sp. ID0503]|uniref:efflux transporter outer membrane subunit n=1 Tax=Sphingomonas sp. ID0503 TaxID=3399691 RepID=UPI003AFAC4D2
MKKVVLGAPLVALILSACDLAPKYVSPALPVPPSAPQGPAYAGQAGAALAPADTAWQDFFTDARLRQLIALALDNNRDLRVAIANVDQARALYRVQRADLFPTIGANGSANYQKTPFGGVGAVNGGGGTGGVGGGTGGVGNGPGGVGGGVGGGGTVTTGGTRIDTYSASLGISAWELDLFGRVRNLTRSAQEQFFAADENRNAAQVTLVAQLATTWVTMAADQGRLRIARDTERAFAQTLELTRARFRVGIASELEVRQAQTTYDQARSDIAEATTLVAQDQNALNLLAGTTVPAELLPADLAEQPATLDNLPADLPSAALLRRPDIAAAEHQLRAANADIGAARAAFFPNISLTAAFGTLSLGLSNLFGSGSNFWSVNPQASVPLLDFGRNKGNLRYAEATYRAQLAQYERAVQAGFREVADALARRGTIGQQLEADTSLRDSARVAYRLSEARFRSGIDPFLTTLDSQRALYSAEQTLLMTRLIRESNAIELYRAFGGGMRSQDAANDRISPIPR